jgi:hypothetical protein
MGLIAGLDAVAKREILSPCRESTTVAILTEKSRLLI